MFKKLTIFLIIFYALLPVAAQAQWARLYEANERTFLTNLKHTTGFIGSINFGLGIPVGDMNEESNLGWNIGASGGYVFNNWLASRVDLAYNSFSSAPFGSSLSLVTLRGDFLVGNIEKNSKTIPYGFAGIGTYIKNVPSHQIYVYDANGNLVNTIYVPSSSESELGIALGGGIGFKLSRTLALYGEAAFCQGLAKNAATSFIHFKAGIMIVP